ncbi:SDR family NAD(P)-dependent oxidoreductase [Streptomyces capitiformicae]|uniref:Short-chain dehydrogenase n=1 Tax=Streptomyces capitiformicae TaxID=2014920 RepID=A0A918ZB50_9ACTN|nr:SDR family NAD(P)-dependent oxidoreductase [Streptomyces capitiformicae]GHE41608.1 short-chain dehydrogenase [Streptomyces capitiformicae]
MVATHTERFTGKTAVVTAGASGIGLGIVRRLIAEGARVVIGDIDEDGLGRAEKEFGASVVPLVVDVRREQDIESLVATAVERYGRLDCAFNVAGGGSGGPLVDLGSEDIDRVLSLTLRSMFLSVKHEAKQFIGQGSGGAIVNITSINAIQPPEGAAPYNAAKAGVVSLTQSAALELGAHGIRVNAVGPGLVETPMTRDLTGNPAVAQAYQDATPLIRRGRPEDIAAAAAFLGSDDAAWTTGQTLYVDGGQSVTGHPRLLRLFAQSDAEMPTASALR